MRSLQLAAAALLAFATPAHALDCGKASTRLERAICGDTRLKAADAAMGQAYAGILKDAGGDAEIRAMLVASQRRWVAARDEALGNPDSWPEDADPETWRGKILAAMQDRTDTLNQRDAEDPLQFPLIARAQDQRQFAAQFTGGPFAGFETRCQFFPSRAGSWADYYSCFATSRYQNNDRVCSVDQDWATYGVTETRSVADVVDGKLKPVASCAVDGASDSTCPDIANPRNPEARWNLQPKGEATAAPSPALAKLDAEAATGGSRIWLYTCLNDPGFPTADPFFDGRGKGP
jgi:uncharacterized protein YecT (DUF1311 family)